METFERKKTALEKELEESRRTLRELKVEVGELQREYCDKKRSLDIALEEMKGMTTENSCRGWDVLNFEQA